MTMRVEPLWTAIVDIVVVGNDRNDCTVAAEVVNWEPSASEELPTASAMMQSAIDHGPIDNSFNRSREKTARFEIEDFFFFFVFK